MSNKVATVSLIAAFSIFVAATLASAGSYNVGSYYFPGWASSSSYWNDIKGLPGSRSPGKSWPDRGPLLGFYPEEQQWVAEKHIDWASSYGVKFFAYDWYWDGNNTYLNHAIDNYLHARNKNKIKFTLLWANNYNVPSSLLQFTSMVDYWLDHYFADSQYLTIDGKPVVFIFSVQQLETNAATFNMTAKDLLSIARNRALSRGFKGIYFVGSMTASSTWVNSYMPDAGYDAISAYNYHNPGFTGTFNGNAPFATSYSDLTEGYKSQWDWLLTNSKLPYFVPVSAGWDKRPWGSNTPHDMCYSNPNTFRLMLKAAKDRLDNYPYKTKGIVIIDAWNEFGEGGYIEPTKKWKFQYLQAVKDIFGQ